jgi:hypothetical protein
LGTDSPTARLHINGTGTGEGNVLFSGSLKTSSPGDPPASGAGTRMMWYPDKAAFRAGQVAGTFWDKDSIGSYSFASGYNTMAKGRYSTAIGYWTRALGYCSIATGYGTSALGDNSVAMGNYSMAKGNYSNAIGYQNNAIGDYSIAMGYGTSSLGENSIAMGRYAVALGQNSFAINLMGVLPTPKVGDFIFRISGATEIGGNVGWTNYSDQRLKKDIQILSAENNLDKIIRLKGIKFRWKDNDARLNLGFIAQEVKDIVPECVHYDELNDIYSMEYTAIIPVLVEGIKEQQKLIEAQRIDIKSLQHQIDELRELIINK